MPKFGEFRPRSHAQWRSHPCAAHDRHLMHRIPPLNNEVCEIVENCDISDLFVAYKKGRAGWREATKHEDLPHRLQ
jgi:hypothetical protein